MIKKGLVSSLVKTGVLAAAIGVSAFVFAAGNGPDWSYEGSNGPANWASLTLDGVHFPYETCGSGKKQSPIDISSSVRSEVGEIKTRYFSYPLNVENNGHTIQVNYAPGSRISVGGQTYYLLQFHFHTRSEHTVNGEHAPMEIHFVHMNSKGQLAVLGVFVEEGESENPTLATILKKAPHEVGKHITSGNEIPAASLLPAQELEKFWSYSGSLTTPPCSEGVNWFVSRKRISASKAQIEKFSELMHHHNYRPVQPLNGREIRNNKD